MKISLSANRKRPNLVAFTLIEIVLVLAIIALMLGAAVYQLTGVFDTGQGFLERRPCRVGTSGVFVALMPARCGLRIGRGLIDRWHHRTIGLIGTLPAVNRFRIEF